MDPRLLKALMPYLFGAGLVVLLVLAGWYLHSDGYDNGYGTSDREWQAKWEKNEKEWNVKWEQKSNELVTAQANASEAARKREQQYQQDLAKVVEDGKKSLQQALLTTERDAADARRMLEQAKRMATHSRCTPSNAPTTAGSVPARSTSDLLADLLGRAEARARELGEAYERARAAGVICTGAYNAQFQK